MDFISPSLLLKYEGIISEINREFEKSQHLTDELTQKNNSIVLYNLIKNKTLDKLCHLDVKIFNNILELYNLYTEEIGKHVYQNINNNSSKYFLIEIYISTPLLEKLCSSDWLIIVSVHNDCIHINKSIKITTKSSTIIDVIHVPEDVIDCTVEASLVSTNNQWLYIKLDSINVDISYHFYKYKRRVENKPTNILHMNTLYNKNLEVNLIKDVIPIEYQLLLPLEKQQFIEAVIRNSYHNLDVELFIDLQTENKKDFSISISASFNKIEILFNRRDSLRIKATYTDLHKVKKYLLHVLHQEGNFNKISGLTEVKNIQVLNLQDAINLYNHLRRLSSVLPI